MELAVLADFLRQRVTELEHGHRHGDDTALETSSTTKQLQANLYAAQVSLRQSQIRQQALEEEVATFEAEIADDRELLNLAAQQDGIGVAEAIRRNIGPMLQLFWPLILSKSRLRVLVLGVVGWFTASLL